MLKNTTPAYNNIRGDIMYNTTINNALGNLKSLIDLAINEAEIINIATDKGNVVMLNESDYRNLLLTLEVEANPEFKQTLIDADNTPLDEFIDESDVEW